jgi:MFS transporter, MHS family, metabolite:H+ symporter
VLVALVFVIFVGGPLPNLYGVESTWLVEMFGSKRRFSFMTTVKEIGAVLSGGLGPILAATVVAAAGPGWIPVAAILMAYAAIGIAAGFFAPETRGRDLNAEADAFSAHGADDGGWTPGVVRSRLCGTGVQFHRLVGRSSLERMQHDGSH